MTRLWSEGDRSAALEAIPESLVDELIVHGTPEECREHIGSYVESGVTTPALAVLPFPGVDQRQAIDPVWWRPDRRAETYVELVDADVEGLLEQLRSNRPGVELQPEP